MRSDIVAVAAGTVADAQQPYADAAKVQEMLLDLFLQAGLGRKDAGAPLCDIIEPGMTVLVKPNWVLHENFSGHGMECLVTHPNLILAVLQEVFKARPGRVIIGDAPIQGCDFDQLVTKQWIDEVAAIASCPFDVVDFRRTVLRKGGLSAGQETDVRGDENYILFDLGKDSLLEPVSTQENRFRITCYDPDQLAEKHRPGKHQYLLCREPFEADVIINLPKLKTHKKAGMTAALKNLVGLNGNKEYLPHHRTGGAAEGGDCYPGFAPLKKLAEYCLDEANRTIGAETCSTWLKRSGKLLQVQGKIGNPEIEGGWHGNDTVWRMTLDLNRLLLYGRADGTLSDTPMRKVYSLTDAIIAGEGEGPLAARPVSLGVLTFASASVFADLVGATLMHFDWRKIPTVREAFGDFRYPLTSQDPTACRVVCNGEEISVEEAGRLYGKDFHPSAGWRGHIEGKGSGK